MTEGRLPGGPVHAVLFDYGLTLVTYRRPDAALARAYTDVAAQLERVLGVPAPSVPELLTAVHDRVDAVAAEHDASLSLEELDIAGAHAEAYRALGLAPDTALLDELMRLEQEAWWEGMTVAPGVPAVLRRLRRAGLRLGLASNAPYRAASLHGQLAHLGLAELLDSATFSSSVGWRKPSPRFFERALADLAADAATTVMVGDRVREDVEGAHAAGMRAIRVRQHRDDTSPGEPADLVLDHIAALPGALGLDRTEDPRTP